MFEIIERIAFGDLNPFKIQESDLYKIEELITSKPIINSGDKIKLNINDFRKSPDIYQMLLGSNKKSSLFLQLITEEADSIKNEFRAFLFSCSDINSIKLYVLRNIQILKDISQHKARNKPVQIETDEQLWTWTYNAIILFKLNEIIVDLIFFAQKTFFPLIDKEIQEKEEILKELSEKNIYPFLNTITRILRLPNFRVDNYIHNLTCNFASNWIKEIWESRKLENISAGQKLFNYYKDIATNSTLIERINFYNDIIQYWEEHLISKNLIDFEYDPLNNDPEIEKILVPLLIKEVDLLESYLNNKELTNNIYYGFSCNLKPHIIDEIFYVMKKEHYIDSDITDFRTIFAPEPTPIRNPIRWLLKSQKTKRGHQIKLYMFLETVFQGELSKENRRKAVHLFVDEQGIFFNGKINRPNKNDRDSNNIFEKLLKDIIN